MFFTNEMHVDEKYAHQVYDYDKLSIKSYFHTEKKHPNQLCMKRTPVLINTVVQFQECMSQLYFLRLFSVLEVPGVNIIFARRMFSIGLVVYNEKTFTFN